MYFAAQSKYMVLVSRICVGELNVHCLNCVCVSACMRACMCGSTTNYLVKSWYLFLIPSNFLISQYRGF